MTAGSEDTVPAGGAPLGSRGGQGRLVAPRRLAWLGTLPLLAQYIARTMPWVTLIAGCLVGTAYLATLAYVADTARWSLTQGDVRFAFIAAVAAMAFAVSTPFRPLTQAAPVPAFVAPAGYLLLAAPVLAATCWVDLRICAHTIPRGGPGYHAAVYPLLAQCAGWCAVTVAVAACAGRSRYADLGGVIAAPISFAAIAAAWFLPASARFLVEPAATAQDVTIAWYAITAGALALTCLALRDRWHRYARSLRRYSAPRR